MISSGSRRGVQLGSAAAVPARLSPLRDRVRVYQLQRIAVVVGVAAVAVGSGWLTARGDAFIVGAALALAAVAALAVAYPAPLAALLVLAVLNGVPAVNFGGRLPGGLKFQDAAVLALGALLLAHRPPSQSVQDTRITRVATIWSSVFIAWWLFTVGRSVLLDSIPLTKAILFGREFVYFPVLLTLALRVRFPQRSIGLGVLLLIGGLFINTIGQTLESATGVSLGWLVHPAIIDPTFGLTRLYTSMSYALNTVLIFAVAFLLSHKTFRYRWLLTAIAILLLVEAGLQLTRANYFSLVIALIAGTAFYAIRYRALAAVAVRMLVGFLALVAVVSLVTTVVGDGSIPIISSVTSRLGSSLTTLLHSTGTVGYREQLDHTMLTVLGTQWPVGLGFLHPAAHYVAALPSGTIRNTDTGFFNILMTMGLVGVALLYAPLLYGLRALALVGRSGLTGGRVRAAWLVTGGVAWIAWCIAGSPTLVFLFSVPGLVLAALVLAALARAVSRAGNGASGLQAA